MGNAGSNDALGQAVEDAALTTGPCGEGFNSAFHLAIMPARFAVERRAWDEAAYAGQRGGGARGGETRD